MSQYGNLCCSTIHFIYTLTAVVLLDAFNKAISFFQSITYLVSQQFLKIGLHSKTARGRAVDLSKLFLLLQFLYANLDANRYTSNDFRNFYQGR